MKRLSGKPVIRSPGGLRQDKIISEMRAFHTADSADLEKPENIAAADGSSFHLL